MNIDFNSPYIEDDLDNTPNRSYHAYGIRKIEELSQQLQAFLNCKTATIQYRFSPKSNLRTNQMDKQLKKTKHTFENQVSEFLQLLSKCNGGSYELGLKQLVETLNLTDDKHTLPIHADLDTITQKLFTTIYVLSDQELYLYPKLLKYISKITQELCTVRKILDNSTMGFYEELRLNYSQLHEDLSVLVPEEKIKPESKHKSLEEGLKEW